MLKTNAAVLWVFVTLTATYLLLVEHPQHDPMRGLVQGGQHVGGGAASRRTATRRYRREAGTRRPPPMHPSPMRAPTPFVPKITLLPPPGPRLPRPRPARPDPPFLTGSM
jgi:hypothetical protein